jgi:iron-sulfur cluster assembly protein
MSEVAFSSAGASYNLGSSGCEKLDSSPSVTDKLTSRKTGARTEMAIILSERAASEVKKVLQEQKQTEATLLRVRVVGGGCSGFSYDLKFDNQFDEKLDSKYEYHGVTVVVDKKSALYLDGTTVDYYEGLEKRGFTFDNPNAVKSCGCGSSFQA